MKSVHIILTSLIILSSCSLSDLSSPIGKTPPPVVVSGETLKPTPTESVYTPRKQSSATTVANGSVTTPTYGSGKMQVEIFADFQCPACIAYDSSVMPIFEEYAASGRLTITYRQFPLSNIHKNAMGDAIAALCSAEQGGYMDYKHGLYSLEKSKTGKTVVDTERIALAKSLGLDEAKFSDCLTTRRYEGQIKADITLGDSKGVSGTPTIYLDGIKIDMSLFRDLAGFRSFLESRMK